MNLYVFRQTAPSWNPCHACQLSDISDVMDDIGKIIAGDSKEILSYDDSVKDWMNSQLKKGSLRQGFGLPGLDLTQDIEIWIKNYVYASWKYWDTDDGISSEACCHAQGRFDILSPMPEMVEGDIEFIPRTPDYFHFTVATVAKGGYEFEDRSGKAYESWKKDFGHVVNLDPDSIREYSYSEETLKAKDFQGYQKAVNRVRNTDRFDAFLSLHYI